MNALDDFLQHGTLPFTGRKETTDRIIDFWRQTPDAEGLRALLITGEAGIGKSRLITEVLPAVEREGGVIIRIKLLPETSASIVPLLARALACSDDARRLLHNDPEAAIGPVLAALRRLSRLRPTLLVLQDMHLLPGEAVPELHTLLDSLADETVSVLCAMRPSLSPAQALFERYAVETIRLSGLSGQDIAAVWQELFAVAVEAEHMRAIAEVTSGNPLAIRAVVRKAVTAGLADVPADSVAGHHRFLQEARQDVGRLGLGMALQLHDDEREAAACLALLGEVFAREAAELLLEDAGSVIERLLAQGILVVSATPAVPLYGSDGSKVPSSAFPLLSFTHTLLHHALAGEARETGDRLARVLAANAPLYSLLPFTTLAQSTSLSGSAAAGVLRRFLTNAKQFVVSPDWQPAAQILPGAHALFARYATLWSDTEREELRYDLSMAELGLLVNRRDFGRYEQVAQELYDSTANPETAEQALRRCRALVRFYALRLREAEVRALVFAELDTLRSCFPEIAREEQYSVIHAQLAMWAIRDGDTATVRAVEHHLAETGAVTEGRYSSVTLLNMFGPVLLRVFDSPQELDERLRLLEQLSVSTETALQKLLLSNQMVRLYDATARLDDLLPALDAAVALHRDFEVEESYHFLLFIRLKALIALGMDPQEVRSQADRLFATPAVADLPHYRQFMGCLPVEALLLCGAPEQAVDLARAFPEGRDSMPPATQILLSLAGDPTALPAVPATGSENPLSPFLLHLLTALHADRDNRSPGAALAIEQLLGAPFLRIDNLVHVHIVLGLMQKSSLSSLAGTVRPVIRQALEQALIWLAERRLPAYMPPLLAQAAPYLKPAERKTWEARLATLKRDRDRQLRELRGSEKIRVSMLGSVTVRHPDGTEKKLSGARMKTVLGLIVAGHMAEHPLSHREFCIIAAGEETPDPERTRNIVYVRLHSLRELLGPEAIITEPEEAPRLNPDIVSVDLLDAHALLRDARQQARRGNLLRAVPALARAQAILRSDVPFPGLYDDYFEAARDDLENLLRSTLLRLSSNLMQEGDDETAAKLLRTGFDTMPDDEELVELLGTALTRTGRSIEAERIRRRAAVACRE